MISVPFKLVLLLGLGFSTVSVGCGPNTQLRPFAAAEPDPISGVWDAVLVVKSGETAGDTLRGLVSLRRSGQSEERGEAVVSREYSGTYDFALASVGAPILPGRGVPLAKAVARLDSLVIELNPGVDHGSLIMRGRQDDDVVIGQWYVTAYALGATGSFFMRRKSISHPR